MTENEIDKWGYQYVYAPDSETAERKRLENLPRSAMASVKPLAPFDVRVETFKHVQCLNSPGLIASNEAFHHLLTEDIKASYQLPRRGRGRLVINPEKRYYISGFTKAI